MAIDPVCKMNVDEKKAVATSDYKGKTYYFCAKVCKEKFDKEPEKYIKGERWKKLMITLLFLCVFSISAYAHMGGTIAEQKEEMGQHGMMPMMHMCMPMMQQMMGHGIMMENMMHMMQGMMRMQQRMMKGMKSPERKEMMMEMEKMMDTM